MSNVRQQRSAGFATMELAQAVRALVAARRGGGRPLWVSSEGSSVQAGATGRHEFGWRDAMDIVVKWRQLAEPNDQVCEECVGAGVRGPWRVPGAWLHHRISEPNARGVRVAPPARRPACHGAAGGVGGPAHTTALATRGKGRG